MPDNKDVVRRNIDGFTRFEHEQILPCLTDDIRWTVFGAFRLEGKEAYAGGRIEERRAYS